MANEHSKPRGLCFCGCGQPTPLAKITNNARGNIAGQPVKYIVGHRARRDMATLRETFWALVDKSRGPFACWEWMGARNDAGYGTFGLNHRVIRAHRLAYEFATGHEPTQFVLHACDNPPCCNPAHLSEGTTQDNTRDMVSKGRHSHGDNHPMHTRPEVRVRGELHGKAKYSDDQVRELRRRVAAGERIATAGRALGIKSAAAYNIAKRNTWTHVA